MLLNINNIRSTTFHATTKIRCTLQRALHMRAITNRARSIIRNDMILHAIITNLHANCIRTIERAHNVAHNEWKTKCSNRFSTRFVNVTQSHCLSRCISCCLSKSRVQFDNMKTQHSIDCDESTRYFEQYANASIDVRLFESREIECLIARFVDCNMQFYDAQIIINHENATCVCHVIDCDTNDVIFEYTNAHCIDDAQNAIESFMQQRFDN